MVIHIEEILDDYIGRANRKIAELSTTANNLLTKTGCNCDVSSYIEGINDINSSLFVLNKGWENIDPTFGYKNYLSSLFAVGKLNLELATLEIIHTYIDRYDMGSGSSIISPLFPSTGIGGIGDGSGSGDGYNTFLKLLDAPSSYALRSGEVVRVNSTEDGLEFFKLNELVDIIIPWVFDGNKVYSITGDFYLHQVNGIFLHGVRLRKDGLAYQEDPNAGTNGTITLGDLTNPSIGDLIELDLKMIEI